MNIKFLHGTYDCTEAMKKYMTVLNLDQYITISHSHPDTNFNFYLVHELHLFEHDADLYTRPFIASINGHDVFNETGQLLQAQQFSFNVEYSVLNKLSPKEKREKEENRINNLEKRIQMLEIMFCMVCLYSFWILCWNNIPALRLPVFELPMFV